MGDADQDVLGAFEVDPHRVHGGLGRGGIDVGGFRVGGKSVQGSCRVGGEEGTRARLGEMRIRVQDPGRDGGGQRVAGIGSDGAGEVADVTAHEDEGVGRGAGEAAHVAHAVARRVQEVETPVAEVVVGR